MTQSNEIAEDLRFVRNAVESRDKPRRSSNAHLIIWTIYSLTCIPVYDFVPRYGLAINVVGMLIGIAVSVVFGKREAIQSGQHDHVFVVREMLHWYVGIVMLFASCFGLALFNPAIGSTGVGQVSVILVGFLYYTAGIHLPNVRFMRWVGPIIVLAGIALPLVPHFRWTVMGLIFALCLMSPVLFSRRETASE